MKENEERKWVKYINRRIDELIKAAEEDREPWLDDVEEAFGFYNCDRSIIFQSALDKDARSDPNNDSQRHIPLVRQHVDSFVASTTHNDIKIRYVPKIDQQGMDDIARMGNALFDSYRTHISWDTKVHSLAAHAALFGRGYAQLYVDEVQDFPEPRADFRLLHAWQVFATPGVPFRNATEVITRCWIDKEELKAQYPEFADEIDKASGSKGKKEEEELDDTTGKASDGSWAETVPGYSGQNATVSKDAMLVRERWRFDPTYATYSEEASEREMHQEHAMLQAAIDTENLTLLPQTPELILDDAQYHDDHSIGHLMFIDGLRKKMAESVNVPDEYGTRMVRPKWSIGKLAIAEQAIALLMAHEQLHADLVDDLEEWEIGKYPKYEGGWRHSIIIDDGDTAIGVYDGASKFYEMGIRGAPVYEFNVQPNPLNLWTPSYACLLVEYNKIVNSMVNAADENFKVFGSHQWWHDKELEGTPGFHLSTDPKEPSIFPANAMQSGKIGIIEAKGIPADVYNMIGLIQSMAQQTSGVFGSIRGERQEGVRSASHEQFLAQANRAQLDTFHRLWKNSLEQMCTDLFKLMLAYPPDDTFVKPMLDGKAIPVDYELLDKIDFAIEVVMQPGGASSTEERQSMLLGFTQNMVSHPLIQNDPQGLVLMFKFMAQAIHLQMPDMAEAMINYAGQLEQRAQAMPPQPQQPLSQAGGQNA